MLLGPAAAGALTAAVGLPWCFAFDALTFTAALIGLSGLPAGLTRTEGRAGFAAVRAGISYAARTPQVRGALLADLAATLFAMPVALFPVINAEHFGGRPAVLGLFTTAIAVGGVTASILSGLATRRRRPGIVLLICGSVWAVSLGLAGVVTHLWTVLALLACAGAADTWAVVSRGTVVQTVTPDAYRGRVSSLEYVAGVAGPELGNLRAGLLAAATSGGAALAIGGLTGLAATALIAATTPALRKFALDH
jgi:MFS family permease